MNRALRDQLNLIRIPNVCTAVADVMAGFLFGGGRLDDWTILLPLAGASSCLYAGGAALNDVCDVRRDAVERPDRPIPSGRVSLRSAVWVAMGLLLSGLALASSVSLDAGACAALLVVAIVLYDRVLKSTMMAPLLMGLCRGLNLMMGLSAAPDPLTAGHSVPVVLKATCRSK